MKQHEINIRDPFVLCHGGKYYLYGTRSATCWGPANGFDCYVSEDLETWEGPIEIFRRPEGFWADRCYWAPECYAWNSAFYLITTLGAADRKNGIYALRSDSPTGPFVPIGARLTPEAWSCIDGTLWVEDGTPWLLFSHSFEDDPKGDLCALPLCPDLSAPAVEPLTLFSAAEAPWARPVPFAKEEFGLDGAVYLSDGPCVLRMPGGKLGMSWSSWSEHGYAVGLAISDSGSVRGPWRQVPVPVYPADGGHGMLFFDNQNQPLFTLHYPNEHFKEHPIFLPAELGADGLQLRV